MERTPITWRHSHSSDSSGRRSRSRSLSDSRQQSPVFMSTPRPRQLSPDPLRQLSGPRSPPRAVVSLKGQTLIAPNTSLARAIVMGNNMSQPAASEEDWNKLTTETPRREAAVQQGTASALPQRQPAKPPAASNLTVLLQQQQQQQQQEPQHNEGGAIAAAGSSPSSASTDHTVTEADTASGPPPLPPPPPSTVLGRSAPNMLSRDDVLPLLRYRSEGRQTMKSNLHADSNENTIVSSNTRKSPNNVLCDRRGDKFRRCMSSKEMKTVAPPSGSPYANMLQRKGEIEESMRERLSKLRESAPDNQWSQHHQRATHSADENSSSASSRTRHETANEMRNRRRAQHAQAVVDDLCDVVTDLFIAESKLLKPSNYGVSSSPIPEDHPADTSQSKRSQISENIHTFVSSLPSRYALGADTPSEVLLHMRLMAAARADKTKAAVHIHNLKDDSHWSLTVAAASAKKNHSLRLVTISCHDAVGLLEYISKLLATAGSRVLDADVMLSTDGIALDRFVVEMSGRLRLDKLANLIEDFLSKALSSGKPDDDGQSSKKVHGPLYFQPEHEPAVDRTPEAIQQEEMESAVPLSEVLLASASQGNLSGPWLPHLRRISSLSGPPVESILPSTVLQMRSNSTETSLSSHHRQGHEEAEPPPQVSNDPQGLSSSMRERRPLVNRHAASDLDKVGQEASSDDSTSLDYLTIPGFHGAVGGGIESRNIPLIPFDELMLIETIGTGRVSTIYRAAWQRTHSHSLTSPAPTVTPGGVPMVALKVAMVNTMTGDTSHVDELRREADIAARLDHPNICDLVGIAADPECFCLAYDFCEGGSLLSLLSDSRRYYEYLPIAMDIANGMAYLHSRSVIHRDLKPSNILLTRDHRAKIADFGMSVRNSGQELTAETGTYRYMAPEVIRHESYSSNADVYSFGLCLWQLITREVPYATMTPIQAAYAVAEGKRPEIPASTPQRLQEIITACWDQESHKRPSFTYVAMALADYAKMAFSPANVGALTLQIANEMLANVNGNSTVNVDFTTPVSGAPPPAPSPHYCDMSFSQNDSNVGLEIE